MRAPADPAAAAWRFLWPHQPVGGAACARLGRGTGSSLEFVDSREYVVGDDLRHVDWRAYARTDQLRVRLFREEVAPALDLVRDVSASMAVTEGKAAAAARLCDAFAFWAERGGGRPREHAVDGLQPLSPLRRDGVRVVISDFLSADDPSPWITRVGFGAALLVVLQVLDPWELMPTEEGAVALHDCEGAARLELVLDAAVIARYRERLGRLSASVEYATRRLGGRFATVPATSLAAMCRDALLPAGIVEAA